MPHAFDLRLASLGALAVLAVGCDDPLGSQSARVSLALTDNPGDVEYVWLDIGEIYLQGGGTSGQVHG